MIWICWRLNHNTKIAIITITTTNLPQAILGITHTHTHTRTNTHTHAHTHTHIHTNTHTKGLIEKINSVYCQPNWAPFWKKSHQNIHQNKSLHNFHKSGQRAIATSINGPDKGHNTYRSVGRGGGEGGGLMELKLPFKYKWNTLHCCTKVKNLTLKRIPS